MHLQLVLLARGRLRGVLFAVMLLWSGARAHAQESPEFADVIKRAVVEFEQAHWDEASALFRRAHELNPSARTWRGLGLTSFELRRYVNAIAELEAALADPRKPLTAPQRREVEGVLKRAREFISVYRVRVVPEQAQVLVDGQPASLENGALFLDPGPHTVLVTATGYQEQREDLRAAAGSTDELSIELRVSAQEEPGPAPEVAPARASTPADAPSASRARRRVWTWVLGGTALAAGTTALGLGLATHRTQEDFDRCATAEGGTPDCSGVADQGQRLQLGTNLTAGLAGAFLVGAITAFFVEGRHRPSQEKHAKMQLSPHGVGVRCRF
jgi:hypothetical protein